MKYKINKESTIVADTYMWMSVNCKEMAPKFEINGLDGLLQLDNWDESYVDFITINKIEALELRGDRFETSDLSLSILSFLPDLRYLRISGKFKKNEYKVIEELEQLEQLSFGDYEGYELDYSKLSKLKAFFSKINHPNHPIFKCTKLKYLGANTSLDDFDPFTVFSNLSKIYLFSRKLENLHGIEKLKNLKLIDIVYGHKLQIDDLNGIHMPNLEKFSLSNCKSIKSLDFVSYFPNLKCIWLDDCGHIDSLKPLINCHKLEFILFADTTIEDGLIDYLGKIPTLLGVHFQNKSHYSLKNDYFVNLNKICNKEISYA